MRKITLLLSLVCLVIAGAAVGQRPGNSGGEQQFLDEPFMPIEQYLLLLTYPEVQNELKMDLKQKVTFRDWVFAPFMPKINRADRFRNYNQQNIEFFNQLQIRGHLAGTVARNRGYDSYNVWVHMDMLRQSQDRAKRSQEINDYIEAPSPLSPSEMASHLRAVAQRIPDLLSPKQLQRLSEIYFQVNGPLILTDKQVARMVPLSQDHATRIDNIAKMLVRRLNDLERLYPELVDHPPTAVFGGREDPVQVEMRHAAIAEKTIQAIIKEKSMAEEAIVQLLTQREQQTWATMLGRPFTVGPGSRGITSVLKPP